MSKTVYLVGGRGYIGSRLARRLEFHGYEPVVIDPGYTVSDTPDAEQDVTSATFEVPKDNAPVVWLACIHRLPPGFEDDRHQGMPWWDYADRLMSQCPTAWHRLGHPIIYVSSAQVVTQGEQDTYARAKQDFECDSVGVAGIRIIRPGTVWGDLRVGDPTNRTQTAVNRWLAGGPLPDENWRAYTTYIQDLESMVVNSLEHCAVGELPGDVLHVTDLPRPSVAEDLVANEEAMQLRVQYAGLDFGNPEHPMARLARARGLPWKD